MVAADEKLQLDIVFDTLASVTAALDGLRLSPVVRIEVASGPASK